MKKSTFFKLVGLVLLYLVLSGFVVPYLLSAPSDLAVISGVVLVIAMIYFFFFHVLKIFKNEK
jgi:hypothetical protein